jgi:hypothetical protein
MNLLLLGGTRFLGRRLVDVAIARGHAWRLSRAGAMHIGRKAWNC